MDFPGENINNCENSTVTEAVFTLYEKNVHPIEIKRLNSLPDIIRFTLLNQDMYKTFNTLIHVLEMRLESIFDNEFEKNWINVVYNLCLLFRKEHFSLTLGQNSTEHNPIIVEYMKNIEIKFLLRILMDVNHQILLKIMDDMQKQLALEANESIIRDMCRLFLKQENIMYRYLTLVQTCTKCQAATTPVSTEDSFVTSPIKNPMKNSPRSIWPLKKRSSQRNSFNSKTMVIETKNSFEILSQMLEADVPDDLN